VSEGCPFCNVPAERLFLVTDTVVGLWDAFPVSDGHALLAPKRHVASWFDATPQERAALAEATATARAQVTTRFKPSGFNIGVNVGPAGGQTIDHLHLHVIPRYEGDVADPRGGVRGVIPAKQNYLAPHDRVHTAGLGGTLISGGDIDPLLPHLERDIANTQALDVAVAFTLNRGVEVLLPHLDELLARGGRLRFLTGDYRDATEPEALWKLLDLRGDVELRVFETARDRPTEFPLLARAFHPKAYILHLRDGSGTAFVGSSNVSASALLHGVEWNYRLTTSFDRQGFEQIRSRFEDLFSHPATSPLTAGWIESYASRRIPYELPLLPFEDSVQETAPEGYAAVTPHEVQEEALRALDETRAAGNTAGLVVLATGLGKTWLSAFDSAQERFRRVLFVAHREEILGQALRTFRQIRPTARLGLYTGKERDPNADVIFASIQTLGRREHLDRFAADAFDYVIVDEFHHAAAKSYRALIDHFEPQFLLGLTATPERTDGGNLLALCQENLVYRCDLAEGIRRDLLAPFRYFGVPDDVDYANIPWRSTRFDEQALTAAVATRRRAENALEQWRSRGGERTLAFCVSQKHADFMATFFTERGLRSVAVHSGATTAPRALSLERLQRGELDIVCAVDMFNEGVDVPELDTVMMLRPTESRILWLQQLGRGLRKTEGKDRLNVIDYIGNHKTFLLKPQTLFDLPAGRQPILNFLDRYRDGEVDLPPGCEVTYDLEAIEILRKLVQPVRGDVAALRRYYEDFRELNGIRPTASEAFHDGYNPRSVRQDHGSWLNLVASMGDLPPAGRAVLQEHGAFLDALETTPMEKSFKMLVLLGMLNTDSFPGPISIESLSEAVSHVAARSAPLRADFGDSLDPKRMRRLLEQNPIAAWTGGKGTGNVSYFEYDGTTFRTTFAVDADARATLQELARELVDWRLAEYLERARRTGEQKISCKVSQSNGRPLLFIDRKVSPLLPEGETPIRIGGEMYVATFVKIAINVVRRPDGGENELPRILRGWFGPDAGMPGTRNYVTLELIDGEWQMNAEGQERKVVQLWREYAREQIPTLFGMEFSTAIWNVGYVARSGHIFLLVTLDKAGHGSEFQYGDRFLDPSTFEWQSQNRTSRDSKDGQLIRGHAAAGVAVHLFVRAAKKAAGNRSAAFVYCGDVEFVDWHGDNPVTVTWRLPQEVPERLRTPLRVPA
jgi:superfamily II DNA or RNA helicase/diadenosine tetraphosphate (Ap4A) HIT family hydrolase/HKD family nuclease